MTGRIVIMCGILAAVAATPLRADPPVELYRGGSLDGSAATRLIAFVPSADATARYAGGSFDGHAFMRHSTYSAPPDATARFAGGSYDGHALAERDTFDLSLRLARFSGGSFDGSDLARAGPYPNPLDQDADDDGVPDWWIAHIFQSVFGPPAGADLDGDGWTTFEEFIADTDPRTAASRFGITAITAPGTPVVAISSSSSNRLYTLEHSPHLPAGGWTAVPGTPQRAGVGGPDAFSDTRTTNSGVYRIRIDLP